LHSALQVGLKASTQTAEETKLLLGKWKLRTHIRIYDSFMFWFVFVLILIIKAVMDWLEQMKKQHVDNEAITNDIAAQAHIENYALKLFLYADKQDREENFGK